MKLLKEVRRVVTIATCILVLPFVAMQITDSVVWSIADFVFAWAAMVGAGLSYQMITRKTTNNIYKYAVGLAIGTALLLVWMNGAVGIIGAAGNDANMMYAGVLAVGLIGVFIARFQPHGMARALLATAFAQAVVTVITLIAGLDSALSPPVEIILLNGFFIALWGGSAWLFQQANLEHAH